MTILDENKDNHYFYFGNNYVFPSLHNFWISYGIFILIALFYLLIEFLFKLLTEYEEVLLLLL